MEPQEKGVRRRRRGWNKNENSVQKNHRYLEEKWNCRRREQAGGEGEAGWNKQQEEE